MKEELTITFTIKEIMANPINFKFCDSCGCLNWHDRVECKNCGEFEFSGIDKMDLKEFKQDKKELGEDVEFEV